MCVCWKILSDLSCGDLSALFWDQNIYRYYHWLSWLFQFTNKSIISVRCQRSPNHLLGICSSLCLGRMVTVGFLMDPASVFNSDLDADWAIVQMLFPLVGGWKFATLTFCRGDRLMEASWVMSLSCWSLFSSAAASGAHCLSEVGLNIRWGQKEWQKTLWEIRIHLKYLQPFEGLSSCHLSVPKEDKEDSTFRYAYIIEYHCL